MNQEQLEHKIQEMMSSEFLHNPEIINLEILIDKYVKEINDMFGYNDGEPLEEDGVEFVITLLKLKLYEANAIYEEN